MTNRNDIKDYASFLKAKALLKDQIEYHRQAIKYDLEEGTRHLKPSNIAEGFGEKIKHFGEKLYKHAEQFIESKLGQQVSSIVSIANFIKDLFGKKDDHEKGEQA